MKTEILVSLFLGWQLTEQLFGPIFGTWYAVAGFGLSWATAFFLCLTVADWVAKTQGDEKAEPGLMFLPAVLTAPGTVLLYLAQVS